MYGEYEAINGAIANALIVERDQLADEVKTLREALKGTMRIWVVVDEFDGELVKGYTTKLEAATKIDDNEYIVSVDVEMNGFENLEITPYCPRPINTATDHSMKWCQENGHCGCVAIEELRKAYGKRVYPA